MDITSLLQFGPKKTFAPAEDAPSIYADPTEWGAYRARQALQATMQAEQDLLAKGGVLPSELTESFVGEVGNDPKSMARELQSLLGRYPENTVLSPNKAVVEPSAASQQQDKPVLATGKTAQHIKQDSINQNFGSAGVRAFTDSKGQLVLTNNPNATDAVSAMRPFTPVTGESRIGAPNALLFNIRSATDLADAQGIFYTLQSAVAESAAKMKVDAITFAEQKVGLPAMRQELQNAIAADRNDPMYRPGMGDSPITAKIRQQVTGLEDQAQQEADRWLSRNVQYAQLNNTITSAKSELDRFTRKEDWKEQRAFSMDMQKDARKQAKEDQLDLQASTVPAEARSRILALHPELEQEENSARAIFNQYQLMTKKGGTEAAKVLTAPENQLPQLAVRGNQTATDLVIQKEAQNTGENPDLIRGQLERAKRFSSDPGFLQKAYTAVFSGQPESGKKIKVALEDYHKLQNGNAEEKEKAAQIRADLALDFFRTTATERFVGDLSKLQTTNIKLGDAVRLAMKNTGSANLENVVTAWIGDATGPAATAAYQSIIAALQVESLKYKDSVFGAPSMPAINAAITEMARAKMTVMGRLKSAIGMVGADTFMPSPMQSALLAKPFTLE